LYIDNTDVPTYIWSFDNGTDWENEIVQGLGSILEDDNYGFQDIVQSSNTYYDTGLSVDMTTDGVDQAIRFEDTTGLMSFDTSDSHFLVEALIYGESIAPQGDRRVVSKYTDTGDMTWQLGTNGSGGVYCALWFDNETDLHLQTGIDVEPNLVLPNVWNRIGCEWNAVDNKLIAYVNGVNVGEADYTGGGVLKESTGNLIINGENDSGAYCNKLLIDEVKITNLTGVVEDPPVENGISFTNTTRGVLTVTTPGTDNVTGTVITESDPDTIVLSDGDTYNQSCTYEEVDTNTWDFSCSTSSLPDEGVYLYYVTVTTLDLTEYKDSLYIDNTDVPTYIWSFDNGTDWEDEIVTDLDTVIVDTNNTVQSNNTFYDTGSSVDLTYFDADQALRYDDSTGLFTFDQLDSHFMVEALIYGSDLTSGDKNVVTRSTQDENNMWFMATNGAGGVYCALWFDDGSSLHLGTNDPMPTNTWNKIGCEWSTPDSTLTIYINGVEVTSDVYNGTGSLKSDSGPLMINGYPFTGWGANKILIDEVKITDLTGVVEEPPVENGISFTNTTRGVLTVTTPGTDNVTGTVLTESDPDTIVLSDGDTYNQSCTYEEVDTNTWDFSCSTSSLPDEGVYLYYVTVTTLDLTEYKDSLYIDNTDVPTYIWSFDNDTDWEDEIVSGLDATLVGDTGYISQSDNIYYDSGKSVDFYADELRDRGISYSDTQGDLSFDTVDSHFKVETLVYGYSFAPMGDRRIVSKYTSTGDTAWQIGNNGEGGIYCALWFDNETDIHLQTGVGSDPDLLLPDTWNKIGCEWDAVEGKLIAYLNDVNVGEESYSGGGVLKESTGVLMINGEPPTGGYGNRLYLDEIKITDLTGIEEPPVGSNSIELDSNAALVSGDSYTLEGLATSVENMSTIQYRKYIEGQGENDNWSNCTCDDGTCDSLSEEFSCNITTIPSLTTTTYEVRFGFGNPLEYVTSDIYGVFDITNDPTDTLQAWWSFDNELALTDYSGNSLDGSMTGSVTLSESSETGSFTNVFDGDTYFEVDDSEGILNFNGTDDEFMVDFWIKPDEGLSVYSTYRILNDDDSNWGLKLTLNHLGDYSIRGHVKSGTSIKTVGEGDENSYLIPGQWNHVVFSYSNIDYTMTLKVNNNDKCVLFNSIAFLMPNPSLDITVGATSLGAEGFEGEIDNILIFDNADTRSPQIEFTPLEDPEWVTDSSQEFEVTVTDETGVESFSYLFFPTPYYPDWENTVTIDQLEWTEVVTPDVGSWGDQEVVIRFNAPALSDGVWYLYVQSEDSNEFNTVLPGGWWYTSSGESSPSVMPYYYFYVEAVDTTPPEIFAHSIIPQETVDTNPGVRGYVRDDDSDTTSDIASIEYKLEKGSLVEEEWVMEESTGWLGITPLGEESLYDSPMEEFYFVLEDLVPSDYRLEIRAEDESGNSTEDNDSNHSEIFTVYEINPIPDTAVLIKEESFVDHTYHDLLFSDGVWGNDILRLRQKIDFEQITELFTNNSDFGFEFGASFALTFEAIDGNLWVVLNDRSFIYYNVDTQEYTRYPILNENRVENIKEVEIDGRRYLSLEYQWAKSTIIYDINNTPENISDDTYVDYGTKVGFTDYEGFKLIDVDTRNEKTALFGLALSSDEKFMIWIDTKGTVMDVSDDTYVTWGIEDNLFYMGEEEGYQTENDIVAGYFDQELNTFIMSSYVSGIFVCNDGGDPENKANDTCKYYDQMTNVFSIIKDPNHYYWLGGDHGMVRIDSKNTQNIQDDTYIKIFGTNGIYPNSQSIANLIFVEGDYPVGDEIWYLTRNGYLRALEYNFTYDDYLDDTLYSYKIGSLNNVISNNPGNLVITDRNTMYTVSQGQGIQKISLTRSFESINTIEMLPIPPDGVLAINYIDLEQVLGTVSEGSSYTLNDLVTYEVSNDSGITWYPITQGERVEFPTPDYKLKLRITLNSGSSPIIDLIKVSYITYASQEENQCDIRINDDSPTITQVQPLTNRRIKVDFTHVSDNTGVTKYILQYALSPSTFPLGSVDLSSSATTYTLSNVTLDTAYYFRVIAQTDCTYSDWSNVLSATNTGDPAQPPVVYYPPVDTPEEEELDDEESIEDEEQEDDDNNIVPPINEEDNETKGDSLFETIKKFFDKVGEIFKSIVTSPEKTSRVSVVTASTLIVTYLTGTAFSSYLPLSYLLQPFNSLFLFLGVKRKDSEYGLVYDSVTKEPLNRAILRIYDESNTLVKTEVTDVYGVFYLDLKKGKYRIDVSAKNYGYPSKLITGETDGIYENIYRGERFIYDTESAADFSIPVDPIDRNSVEYSKVVFENKVSSLLIYLQRLLLIFGLTFALISYIGNQSTFNLVILLLYTIFLVVTLILINRRRGKFGIVYDIANYPKEGVRIGLRETEFDRISAERITNENGKYRFVVPGGEYLLEVLDSQYEFTPGTDRDISSKKGSVLVVNKNLRIRSK
jgi:hypothetical protein